MKLQVMKASLIKRKRARPLAELHKSLLYQALKSFKKTVKVVKGLLILKITRKISELKSELTESNMETAQGKLEIEISSLASMKAVDHNAVGEHVCNTMLSIGRKETQLEINSSVELLLKQSRIQQAVKEAEENIVAAVNKNNALRADEQSRDAKKAKSKGLLAQRKIEQKDLTKAVFVSSLEGDSLENAQKRKDRKKNDKTRLLKNLRNQQNRTANKSKSNSSSKSESDVSMYMSEADRRRAGGNTNMTKTAVAVTSSFAKRKRDIDNYSAPPVVKKVKTVAVQNLPATMTSDSLEKCVTSGKEWKESGVHPSWAAKQLSKHTPIVIAKSGTTTTGKKITFD